MTIGRGGPWPVRDHAVRCVLEPVVLREGWPFPRDSGGTYTRRMDWGEYVPFTSGAGRRARGTGRMTATWLSFTLITACDCSRARCVAPLTSDPQGLCP
jgi:hypothetical protein